MKNFENTIEIKIDFQELFDDVLSEAKQRDFILMNSDSLTDEDVVRIFKSRQLIQLLDDEDLEDEMKKRGYNVTCDDELDF
jgi:hypothetical protein